MLPEDPRHGTNAGYGAGCREECCRDAHAAYRRAMRSKRYLLGVDALYIDATGTHRRIRALQRLGWRFVDIDRAMGHETSTPNATRSHNYLHQTRVHVENAQAVARAYDALSMTLGPSARLRAIGQRKGWLPPLAWTDVDDPNEKPNLGHFRSNYSSAELLDEWDFLRRSGLTMDAAAERLGVTRKAIEKALSRASRRAA